MPYDNASSTIQGAFDARGIAIEPASELGFLLEEVAKFEASTRDLAAAPSDSETDERAVATGGSLLRAVRLADSISLLANHQVPKVTETLETLAAFQHGHDEHEAQFDEAEYELHMASQFVNHGQRVSFVQAKAVSRYRKRVEFMLGYKWPVECKRPRSRARIMENVDNAITKINERKQPGIVCVGLEAALPMADAFLEVEDLEDISTSVSEHLGEWLKQNQRELQSKLAAGWARFLIVTFMVQSYIHSSGEVALPSLRLGISARGGWLTTAITRSCIEALKNERDELKGQKF